MTLQDQNSALTEVNEDLSLGESCARRISAGMFPLFDLGHGRHQATNALQSRFYIV